MPSKKNPNKDTTPEVEPAPAPPADEAAQVPATATPTNTATHYTRGVIGQRDSRSQSGQDAPEDSVTPAPSGNDSSSSGT